MHSHKSRAPQSTGPVSRDVIDTQHTHTYTNITRIYENVVINIGERGSSFEINLQLSPPEDTEVRFKDTRRKSSEIY